MNPVGGKELFSLGAAMGRIVAEQLRPEPTVAGLLASAQAQLRHARNRLAAVRESKLDDPLDEQDVNVAFDCCQSAIEKLQGAASILEAAMDAPALVPVSTSPPLPSEPQTFHYQHAREEFDYDESQQL